MVSSCTSVLEIVAILATSQPGDETIFPSYICVTTASSFAFREVTLLFEYIFIAKEYSYGYTTDKELFGLIYLARMNSHIYETCSTDPSPCQT